MCSFQKLFELGNAASIHYRNICLLVIELFKVTNSSLNQIMSELFDLQIIGYNLCSQKSFLLGAVYTTNNGLRSLRHFAQKVLNMMPADIGIAQNLSTWTPHDFPCNLYRVTSVKWDIQTN